MHAVCAPDASVLTDLSLSGSSKLLPLLRPILPIERQLKGPTKRRTLVHDDSLAEVRRVLWSRRSPVQLLALASAESSAGQHTAVSTVLPCTVRRIAEGGAAWFSYNPMRCCILLQILCFCLAGRRTRAAENETYRMALLWQRRVYLGRLCDLVESRTSTTCPASFGTLCGMDMLLHTIRGVVHE